MDARKNKIFVDFDCGDENYAPCGILYYMLVHLKNQAIDLQENYIEGMPK